MSFLRRVLARGEGRGVLGGAPRHVFRREVEVPSLEVASPVTPTTTPALVHVSRPPQPARGPEATAPRTPRVPAVDTRVERFEQVERQIVREPYITNVHVHVPPAVPPAKASVTTPSAPGETRRVLEHHHHEHTRSELRETHHVVTERVEVRTTAPQAVVPPARRSMPTPAVERTPVAVAPAAPPPVHVSIGRIVLSAAPAPSKPERPRSPAAPARSLADILAAKKGRP